MVRDLLRVVVFRGLTLLLSPYLCVQCAALLSDAPARRSPAATPTRPELLWAAGAGAPEGVHAGGRWGPMARRRRRFLDFLGDFLLVFMGIRRTRAAPI